MRRAALVVLAGVMVLAVGGCGAWIYHLIGKPREYEDVPAEYALEADRLVIVPYAGTDILFSYPTVSIELSHEIVYALASVPALKTRVRQVEHPVTVVKWQESNLDWANLSLEEIGKRFHADAVLYVELQRYTMIEERSANLYRGRAVARVQVARPGADHNPVYETTVDVTYPPNRPVGVLETSEAIIRRHTNVLLAEAIVNKFHDRRVEVKGGAP